MNFLYEKHKKSLEGGKQKADCLGTLGPREWQWWVPELSTCFIYVGLGAGEGGNPDSSGHREKSPQETLPFLGKGPQEG